MRRMLIISGVVVLAAMIVVGSVMSKPSISRDKYPYVGLSTISAQILDGTYLRADLSLEEVMSDYGFDTIVQGAFLSNFSDAKIQYLAVTPEEGTIEYHEFLAFAERSRKKPEECCPVITYYELQFEVQEVFGGEVQKGDVITVQVRASSFDGMIYRFPNVIQNQQAIICIRPNPYVGDDSYWTSSMGFYYIDENDVVISSEKYPSLDQYTGEKIDDFVSIISDKYVK